MAQTTPNNDAGCGSVNPDLILLLSCRCGRGRYVVQQAVGHRTPTYTNEQDEQALFPVLLTINLVALAHTRDGPGTQTQG